MTDRAMPAATSHEDIYQISSSFCSSSYPSSSASSAASSPSFSHLPGYMMFMDGQLNGSQQRFNPLKGDSSSSSSSSGGSSKTITCQQQHQRHRHLSSNQQHNQKFHQLYQKHIQATASPSRQQVVAKQSKSHHISYQWLAQPYSLMAAYDEQANSLAGLVEPVMVFCDDDANYNDQINKKQLSNSYTATYNSETDLISSDGDNCFSLSMTPPTQHYLTIEELRLARNSCWLCGCNWQQDHVSLDCSECGGYSLTRPCPSCDGDCKQIWERNINETHDNHKATWVGRCNKLLSSDEQQATKSTSISNDHNQLNVPPMASSCCSSQPSSAASSDSESDCQQATISKPTTEQQQSHRPTTSALCICN